MKNREQVDTDNGDLGTHVVEEVRSNTKHKNKKKRDQEAPRRRDTAETHENKLIEVCETELKDQGGKLVKTESALQLSTILNFKTLNCGCKVSLSEWWQRFRKSLFKGLFQSQHLCLLKHESRSKSWFRNSRRKEFQFRLKSKREHMRKSQK